MSSGSGVESGTQDPVAKLSLVQGYSSSSSDSD
jgi:hypothetical protein